MAVFELGIERNDPKSIKSLRVYLLHTLLTGHKNEITPFELLYIAEKSGLANEIPSRVLVDIYMNCGCFNRASLIFSEIGHYRKLGDLAWIQGKFQEAYDYYSMPNNIEGKVPRIGPDWDRLIKLSFYEGKWQSVLNYIEKSNMLPGMGEGRIILAGYDTSMKPYVNMLAISSKNSGMAPSYPFDFVKKTFRISKADWSKILNTIDESKIPSFRKKVVPIKSKIAYCSIEDALIKGNTFVSNNIIYFLNNANTYLSNAKKLVRSYLENGNDNDLQDFVNILLKPGVFSLSQLCVSETLPYWIQEKNKIHPERLAKLYGCHPFMNRRHFGDLLGAKFKGGIPLTGSDILTGIFQRLASVDLVIEKTERRSLDKRLNKRLDQIKLNSVSDWAEMRLSEWVENDGGALIFNVSNIWNEGRAALVTGPFDNKKHYPESPRSMREWMELVDHAQDWLYERWKDELGVSPWISEGQLFEFVKKAFKGKEVIRNAMPLWLSPQHLDVFVPELSLAIEYMGLQHYEPIEIFGGEDGFKGTKERDGRKAEICRRANILLFYVKHDEKISERVKQIYEFVQNK